MKPDIYVKGKEYETKGDPRFPRERELVEELRRAGWSSARATSSTRRRYILSQFRDGFRLEQERLAFYSREGISSAPTWKR